MPDKGGIQLLPETRKSIIIKVPGENRLIYAGIALIAVMLVLYGVLAWYTSRLNNNLAIVDGQLTALESQRNPQSEQAISTLAAQMKITTSILGNHVYWSTGFNKIESVLQNQIQFTSFAVSVDTHTVQIGGLTSDYTTLARQVASFSADDSILNVSLDNVTQTTAGQLKFSITITFDPKKFLAAPTTPSS